MALTAVTAVNVLGVSKTAGATRWLVAVTVVVLATVVVVGLAGGRPASVHIGHVTGVHGVLTAAGQLFFAFAGYARVATLGDIRGAIGFSSCTVLVYYAVTNAAALTLGRSPGRRTPAQALAVIGLVGCVVLALSLPWGSVLAGFAVLAVGLAGHAISRVLARSRRRRA